MRKQRIVFLLVFVALLTLVAVSCDNSSSPKVYTVTVDYGDGFDKTVKEVKEGDKFTLPEAKTKEGFEFDYYTDEGGGKHNAGEEITVKADMTFTAKWTALYSVKVDNANETDVTETKVRAGENFTLPSEEPEKEGSVFLCYKDAEGNEYKAGASVKVEKSLTFTASWRVKTETSFTVKVDDGTDISTTSVKDGDKFKLPEAKTKEGFEFDCYTDGGGGKHNAGEEITVKADMTFTAKWTALYSVKVDNANGTDVTETKVRAGENFTLPSEEPEKEGSVFLCYKDAEGNEYKAGASVKVEKSLTFTASWRVKTETSFTVKVDDGTDISTTSVKDGDKFTLPHAVERTDYEFISYKCGGSTYKPGDTVTVVSDMTFTAEWARLYTLTVNSNNGTAPVTTKVREGEYTLPSAPEKGSAEFKAWKLGEKEYNAGDKITIESDIEIKALWKQYTVTFRNGDTVVDTKTVESGQPVAETEKTVIKDGYTLTGWSYNSALYDFSTPVTKDIVLEAVWLENGKVTVTLREDGRERIFTIESGTDFEIPSSVVTKKGFTFNNWKRGENVYETGTTISGVTENIVLEAQYTAVKITVTFKYLNADGNSVTTTTSAFDAGTAVPQSEVPEITLPAGAAAIRWRDNSYNNVDITKPLYETTTLTAVFDYQYFTVIFNYNDGGATQDYSLNYVTYGNTIKYQKPSDPVRSGYNFLGWFESLDDGTAFDFDNTKVTGDLTLYAKWDEIAAADSVTLTLKGDEDTEKGISAFSKEYKVKKGTTVWLYDIYDYTTGTPYEITGWKNETETETETEIYAYNRYSSITLNDNMSLSAVWTEKKFGVSFHFEGGKYVIDGVEHTNSYYVDAYWGNTISDVLKGTLTKDDGIYTLDYWALNYYLGERYDVSQKITRNLNLYAVWKTDKTQTVTFNYGYDDRKETKTVTYGTAVTEPVRPVRVGYSFDGWYSDDSPFDFSSEIKSDVSLTAKWTAVSKYTITYMNIDGETVYTTEDVDCGGKAKGVVIPSLSGMEAEGWYRISNDPLCFFDSPYDFSSSVQENMILVPKYIPSENKLLGVWRIMDYSPIDFRKEDGENVFYLTDFVNYGSTTLVKAGTWYYDPETGYLALNAEGINALFINAMNTGYGISEPNTAGERLFRSSYDGRYELKRETPSETVKGTWKGEYNNWKIDLTLADDTYDEQRILYRNSAGEGGTVAKIDTSGNYEVQPNTDKMYEVEEMVSFGNNEKMQVIGTQKTTFQSWLVFAGGSDSIAVGGLLGSDLCILTR